jgi:hypothetical protein
MEGWNTTWPGMPNTTLVEVQKSQEVVNSQENLIIVDVRNKLYFKLGTIA